MATYTAYKNLEKPLSTEKYDINVANKNNDVIDSELHKLDLKNQNQDDLLATKVSLSQEISRATNTENEISANLNNEISRATFTENELSSVIENEINRATISEELINENLNNHNFSTLTHSDIRAIILELTQRIDILEGLVNIL